MTAAQSPWMQEYRFPASLRWVKKAPQLSNLIRRTTPTGYAVGTVLSDLAAAADTSKDPGETEIQVTLLTLRQFTGKGVRCIEMAMEELARKNFWAIRTVRPGLWQCRALPENWTQGPGEPGGLMVKAPRKAKPITASHNYEMPRAALHSQLFSPSGSQPFSPSGPPAPGDQGSQPFSHRTDSEENSQGFSPSPESGYPSHPSYKGTPGEENSQGFSPSPGAQTFNAKTYDAPGEEFRPGTQADVGISSKVCSYPSCIRQTPELEELASRAKPAASQTAETADLAERIADLRSKGYLQSKADGVPLETPNERTLQNLLNNARQRVPGPLEIATFLAMRGKKRKWENWGVVNAAVKADLVPFLHDTGWFTQTGKLWKNAGAGLETGEDEIVETPQSPLPTEPPGNPWASIREQLRSLIAPGEWTNWFSGTVFGRASGENIVVFTQDQLTKDMIEQEFSKQIARAVDQLNLPIGKIVFEKWRGPS